MIQALRTDILLLSFELGNGKWLLTFSAGQRLRRVEIQARDLRALEIEIAAARKKFGLAAASVVHSCYEAGRDGFWLHRALTARGVINLVIDPSSIEVDRRKRRAKNDRLDGEALLRLLARYIAGERKHLRIVRVPSANDEDARRPQRELERLTRERTAHINRIRSLLALEGVVLNPGAASFVSALSHAQRWDGQPLGTHLLAEIHDELERMEVIARQIKRLRIEQDARAEQAPDDARHKKLTTLRSLKGINRSAYLLVFEFFAWRTFSNRREVGAAAGLVGTPYQSGDTNREQGISKAGNARIRTVLVELAWRWVRFQPQSALTQWYQERFGQSGGRRRRVGIVALARRLLIALWRLVEQGVVPEGVAIKST